MKKRVVTGAVCLVLGFACGVSFNNWQGTGCRDRGRKRVPPPQRMEQLKNRLNLSLEQEKKIKVIFDEQGEKFRTLHKEGAPEFQKLIDETGEAIRSVLSPEQTEEFEKIHKRARNDMGRHRGGPPPEGPPPGGGPPPDGPLLGRYHPEGPPPGRPHPEGEF